MYAIIRAGGKQAKVSSGDVIDIERLKNDAKKLTFSPLLVVDDEGNAVSDPKVLGKAKVTAKVVGETRGPKVDIFKYKSKTGYSRRQGHRQTYTRIEITGITLPGQNKTAKPKAAASPKKESAKPKAAASPKKESAKPKKQAASSEEE